MPSRPNVDGSALASDPAVAAPFATTVSRLSRCVRLAFAPAKLIPAIVGLMLLQAGWALLDRAIELPDQVGVGYRRLTETTPTPFAINALSDQVGRIAGQLAEPILAPARALSVLFSIQEGVWRPLSGALAWAWAISALGLTGAIIVRLCVGQLARGQSSGSRAAFRLVRHRWKALLFTPLCPLYVLALTTVVVAAFGLILRIPMVGSVLGGLLLFIPILLGLLMVIVVVAAMAAWPLMIASAATDAEDTLESISRSLGYLNQRSGRYALLLFLAWIIGIPAQALVDGLAWGTLYLSHWGLSLTAGSGVNELFGALRDTDSSSIPNLAAAGAWFWQWLTLLVAHAWSYSYFWCVISAIYLMLRRDVDGTPWFEIGGESEIKGGRVGDHSYQTDGTAITTS
jgi:hypothetical protein